VINNIELGFLASYISPVIYISFLFTLPINISKYVVLILAFFLGLTLDVFQDTYGIHASACVFLALIRPRLLESFSSDSIEKANELTIFTEDRQKYITYIFILTFMFFIWLFILEEFSFTKIPLIVLKTILSSVISTILILLGQLLLFQKPTH
jgi:hypothetical protein